MEQSLQQPFDRFYYNLLLQVRIYQTMIFSSSWSSHFLLFLVVWWSNLRLSLTLGMTPNSPINWSLRTSVMVVPPMVLVKLGPWVHPQPSTWLQRLEACIFSAMLILSPVYQCSVFSVRKIAMIKYRKIYTLVQNKRWTANPSR